MGIWGGDGWHLSESVNVDNVGIVIGAYRSLIHPIAYISMPITTGRLFYEVLERNGVKSLEELVAKDKDILFRDVIKPNIIAGVSLAERISGQIILPVVAPSIFEAKKQRWGQNDYMFLWFRVLEEKAEQIYMMDGWEYSNGGSEEFVRAMEMQFGFINPDNGMDYFPNGTNLDKAFERLRNVRVYDERGKEIRLNEGFRYIKRAILDLNRRGFHSDILCESLSKLASICGFMCDPISFVAADFDRSLTRTMPYDVDFSILGEFNDPKIRALINYSRMPSLETAKK